MVAEHERRREGRRNDANVVRIISREWQAWIARGWVQKTGPRIIRLAFRKEMRRVAAFGEASPSARRQKTGDQRDTSLVWQQ
jgi:hypothetical protein